MAKIIIAGDAVVVQSAHKLEEYKTLEKYAPKSLYLYEEDEDGKKFPVFRACTGKFGGISAAGVVFSGEARDGSGLATITQEIPAGVADAKAWVSDEFGKAVVQLNKLEEGFEAALAQVEADKAEIEANIEVIG